MHNSCITQGNMTNSLPLVLVNSGATTGMIELTNGDVVKVGSEYWFKWLKENNSFRFESGFAGENSFTARKHIRDTSDFWYAYRKIGGELRSAYLGKPEKLDVDRLLNIAVKLSELSKPDLRKDQLGNGYASHDLESNQEFDCITLEVMQQTERKVVALVQENEQLKLQVQELQNQVDRHKVEHESRVSGLAVAMENVKSNAASKLIKAVKEAYPELA